MRAKAKYAVVYSLGDPAGRGAATELLELVGAVECTLSYGGRYVCFALRDLDVIVAGLDTDTIMMDFLDQVFECEAYIVLSKHSSATSRPTLSVHHTGNPTHEALYGGRPRELAWAFPRLAKLLTLKYFEEARRAGLLERYSFTLEATHHGPTSLSKPIVFVEIGSSEKEWRDKEAHETLARAVLSALSSELPRCRPAVGLGGTHYPEKHTQLMLFSDVCYGHILAKHALGELDEYILEQALSKSVDPIEVLILLKVPGKVRALVETVAARRGVAVEKA